MAPELLIALGLFFGVAVLSEPFFASARPVMDFPLQIKFPVASGALRATIAKQVKPMIDKLSMLSLLLFFIIQAFIYLFCRMKLSEIRRQPLPSRLMSMRARIQRRLRRRRGLTMRQPEIALVPKRRQHQSQPR